jgi:hypothetical protein
MAAPKPRAAAKPKGKRNAGLYRPGLLTLALVLFWAAAHQPAEFTPVATIVWLLGAATGALLVRAGLAFLEPAVRLVVVRWREIMPRGDLS